MKYISTRNPKELFTFGQVVMRGLADDGGLYIPERVPELSTNQLAAIASAASSTSTSTAAGQDGAFREICQIVFPMFIDDIDAQDLQQLIAKSFSSLQFRHSETTTPISRLTDHLYLLELFHGPTFAFKDIALQFLGNLFEYYLERERSELAAGSTGASGAGAGRDLVILGATSGDTGSAAIEGVRGRYGIEIYMLHPHNRISPIQQAQMTSCLDRNVYNLAVGDGATFDDCQRLVKQVFSDRQWLTGNKIRLGAVNSINWARILSQTVYYFYAFYNLKSKLSATSPQSEQKIRFSVPTGNFGDILAGYYAKRMGLPIDGGLLIATNQNDILHRFFTEGVYEKRQVEQTPSPAMDIQVSSNFERWLWHFMYDVIAQQNVEGRLDELSIRRLASECVCNWLERLSTHGSFSTLDPLPTSFNHFSSTTSSSGDKNKLLEDARKEFMSCRVSNQEIIETIARHKDQYVLDPHTAVGVCAATKCFHLKQQHQHQQEQEGETRDNVVTICLATAHPIKFISAVVEAVEGCASAKASDGFTVEREVLAVDRPRVVKGLTVPASLVGLMERPQKLSVVANSIQDVENFILQNRLKEN